MWTVQFQPTFEAVARERRLTLHDVDAIKSLVLSKVRDADFLGNFNGLDVRQVQWQSYSVIFEVDEATSTVYLAGLMTYRPDLFDKLDWARIVKKTIAGLILKKLIDYAQELADRYGFDFDIFNHSDTDRSVGARGVSKIVMRVVKPSSSKGRNRLVFFIDLTHEKSLTSCSHEEGENITIYCATYGTGKSFLMSHFVQITSEKCGHTTPSLKRQRRSPSVGSAESPFVITQIADSGRSERAICQELLLRGEVDSLGKEWAVHEISSWKGSLVKLIRHRVLAVGNMPRFSANKQRPLASLDMFFANILRSSYPAMLDETLNALIFRECLSYIAGKEIDVCRWEAAPQRRNLAYSSKASDPSFQVGGQRNREGSSKAATRSDNSLQPVRLERFPEGSVQAKRSQTYRFKAGSIYPHMDYEHRPCKLYSKVFVDHLNYRSKFEMLNFCQLTWSMTSQLRKLGEMDFSKAGGR